MTGLGRRSSEGWPAADGLMAEQIRGHPWDGHDLGPTAAWPLCLKSTVDVMLRGAQPIAVYWGPDGVLLFNDDFAALMDGGRDMLGARVASVWPEMAELHSEAILAGLAGEALSCRSRRVVLPARDAAEDIYFDLDFIPILDLAGQARGVLAIFADRTHHVRTEHELRRLTLSLEAEVSERTGALAQAVETLNQEIEDRKAAEDALRQSHKLEAIGQLTGGIAHDFNNLLTGIMGSLDLMQRRLAQGRLDEVERFAASAMTSANRAAALTHRLLTFSRRRPLARKIVETDRLIGAMEDLLRRTLSERIALDLILRPDGWRCECDPSQLESAILNLVINARDAMPGGGRITIETGRETVERPASRQLDVPPGDYSTVTVSDTGGGMTPEVIAHVFEPFFTTKPVGVGTGLGLPMIYSFARQSGGAVRVDSKVGAGTSVAILLPRCLAKPQTSGARPPRYAPLLVGAGRTVLVVEDEQSVRALVMEVLQEHGFHGLAATDGEGALELLRSGAPLDLLISDIGLPGLDGHQLAEAALQHRPGLKVLLMTGHAPDVDLSPELQRANVRRLLKPFTLEGLVSHIEDSLESTTVA